MFPENKYYSACLSNIIPLGVFKIIIIRTDLYFTPLLFRSFIIYLQKAAATLERKITYTRYSVSNGYAR